MRRWPQYAETVFSLSNHIYISKCDTTLRIQFRNGNLPTGETENKTTDRLTEEMKERFDAVTREIMNMTPIERILTDLESR